MHANVQPMMWQVGGVGGYEEWQNLEEEGADLRMRVVEHFRERISDLFQVCLADDSVKHSQ